MDKKAKKAISKNRVKLLGLDYFDLSAPMLASEVLPTKKHKDIKTEATTNKARIDLLLEWIDESAPSEAFQPFLQGIRNCQENVLAKRIKKEAADGGIELPKKPAVAKTNKVAPSSLLLFDTPATFPSAALDKLKPKSPKPKTPKKPKDETKPEVSGLGTLTLPFNGLGALLPPPVGIPTPQSRKRKSGADKPKTNETPAKPNDDTKVVAKSAPTPKSSVSTPKIKTEPTKKPQGVKVKIPKPPRVTRTSSTDKGDETDKKAKPAQKKKAEPVAASPSGAPKSPTKVTGKAKVMTFKEVETKQQDSRQKFRFKNSAAAVKLVHFKDKTDISYLGCPFEENNKACEKKVELKSKEFVCESRHRSPNCKQIPRLYVTCNDGTSDMQLTFLKKNVEIFCGKNSTELGTLSINDIKNALDTTIGKKYSVEVHCEKAKKATKKSGVPKWNNIADILSSDDGSPAKKKRKN